VRRLIAQRMTTAHREIPPVTFVEECDFSGVDLRLVVALCLKAIADNLPDFPEMNAQLDGDEIVYCDSYDIGLAVTTQRGLVVPVIRDCGARSVEEVDAEVKRLAALAKSGRISPQDMRGSTFTFTSPGKLGGLFATPIINHPQSAILGLHRIDERAVVRDGNIVVRKMGNLSLTFDHRLVDGARAGEFCLAIVASLYMPR
jgi:pyruvate/2-oxoglutarate dehydrogenase complex dihydrolipoamide acyltransferase (E2) component